MPSRYTVTIFLALAMVTVATGCTKTIYTSRLDAYRAISLKGEEFEKRPTEFVAVKFFPLNPILVEGEAGNAWKIVAREADGDIEEVGFAARVEEKNGQGAALLAIIPRSLASLKGARFALLSHDSTQCYDTEGREFGCPDLKEFKWDKHGVPFVNGQRGVWRVRKNDQTDQELTQLYREMLKIEMVKKFGTSLSPARYELLLAQSSLFRTIATEVLTQGIIFGEVLLLNGWESALATVGLLESMKLLSWLMAPKRFRGPEYFSALATNRQLALKVVQLRLEMIKRDKALADRQEGFEQQLSELRQQVVEMKDVSSPSGVVPAKQHWWEVWK